MTDSAHWLKRWDAANTDDLKATLEALANDADKLVRLESELAMFRANLHRSWAAVVGRTDVESLYNKVQEGRDLLHDLLHDLLAD